MGTNFYLHYPANTQEQERVRDILAAKGMFPTSISAAVAQICQAKGEKVHIGKRSAGWTFSFHATDTIRSYADWKLEFEIPGVEIRSEYGDIFSAAELDKEVQDFKKWKGKPAWNHAEINADPSHSYWIEQGYAHLTGGYHPKQHYRWKDDSFLDPEGNSMSPHEFS